MEKGHISHQAFIKGIAAGAASLVLLGVLQVGESAITKKLAEASSGSLSYTAGTYTAQAKGIDSDITATVTFDDSSITAAEFDVSGETAGIGAEIGDEMAGKILEAQSCNVDGVSSATITSDAIKQAVADCMSQASGTTVTVQAPAAQ